MPSDSLATEADLLARVETALEGVVRADEGMVWKDDSKFTKRQKYVDNIVTHFSEDPSDPPVSRSWYRYGRTLVEAPSGPGKIPSPQHYPPRQNNLKEASIEEMEEFLRSDQCHPKLNKRWWTEANSYDFLEEYYRYQAPEEFRSLYLENLDLRRVFEVTRDDIANARSPHQDLSDPVDHYEEVRNKVARIQMELAKTDDLAQALDPFRNLTDLIEDVYMRLSETKVENLSGGHLAVIKNIGQFYDDVFWQLPASLMSKSSATGPNEDWLVDKSQDRIHAFQPEYQRKLNELEEMIAEEGLLPSVSEYEAPGDDVEKAIEDVMHISDKHY